jgi:acyl-CoA thioesterase-1
VRLLTAVAAIAALALLTLLCAGPGYALAASEAPKTIVCLGDSLTAGYGLSEEEAYPALVQAKAIADGHPWTVINAGVSGDTTNGGLHRVAWVLKAKPDLVLVCLGGNDGLRGLPLEHTQDNLRQLVEKLHAAGAATCIAGMQLPANFGDDYRQQFAALFPAVAHATHSPLLPFLLAGVGGIPTLNQGDGIHPNHEGQRLVAETVYRFLLPQLVVPAAVAAGAGTSTAPAGGAPDAPAR